MKTTRFLLGILAAMLSPLGNAQPVKVTVLAVDSVEDFRNWLGKPVDADRAASAASYPGRLTQLPFGRKTPLPILVTGLAPPAAQPIRFVADVEVLGTDGRTLGSWPRCCEVTIRRGSKEGAALLTSTVSVEPEAGHAKGSYTVRVSVTDGTQTWTAAEMLPYGTSDLPGSANEAPRLRQNVPPARREPGGPGDRRDCLSLPTPGEVIKCSEKK